MASSDEFSCSANDDSEPTEPVSKKSPSESSQYTKSSLGSDFTTPSYIVEENSDGELVNDQYRVVWPTRVIGVKRYPYYSPTTSSLNSLEEEGLPADAPIRKKIAARRRKKRGKRLDSAPSSDSSHSSETSSSEEHPLSKNPGDHECRRNTVSAQSLQAVDGENEPRRDRRAPSPEKRPSYWSMYIGSHEREVVDFVLKPGLFFLYYDPPAAGEELPVKLPLKIGFMNSKGETFHRPIERTEYDGAPLLAVYSSSSDTSRILPQVFTSLDDLVQGFQYLLYVEATADEGWSTVAYKRPLIQ